MKLNFKVFFILVALSCGLAPPALAQFGDPDTGGQGGQNGGWKPGIKINPSIALSDAVGQRSASSVALQASAVGGLVDQQIQNKGGLLGQRVGRFRSVSNGYGVRAAFCYLSGTRTDDNASLTRVLRSSWGWGDGTYWWYFDANNHFPGDQWMSCHFNGPSDSFEGTAFPDGNNQEIGSYWRVDASSGFGHYWYDAPPYVGCPVWWWNEQPCYGLEQLIDPPATVLYGYYGTISHVGYARSLNPHTGEYGGYATWVNSTVSYAGSECSPRPGIPYPVPCSTGPQQPTW